MKYFAATNKRLVRRARVAELVRDPDLAAEAGAGAVVEPVLEVVEVDADARRVDDRSRAHVVRERERDVAAAAVAVVVERGAEVALEPFGRRLDVELVDLVVDARRERGGERAVVGGEERADAGGEARRAVRLRGGGRGDGAQGGDERRERRGCGSSSWFLCSEGLPHVPLRFEALDSSLTVSCPARPSRSVLPAARWTTESPLRLPRLPTIY